MGAGALSEFDDQTEELVMIEGKKMGKLESHAGILPGMANPTPH